jgi:anaerobic ribonucleoside-triphosphate reductase
MTDKKDPLEAKIKRFKRGSALDKQIGGSHYKNAKIEVIQLIVAHKLDFIDGNIVKYAVRKKNYESDRERYEKIKHYCELALELKCGSH